MERWQQGILTGASVGICQMVKDLEKELPGISPPRVTLTGSKSILPPIWLVETGVYLPVFDTVLVLSRHLVYEFPVPKFLELNLKKQFVWIYLFSTIIFF